MPKGIAVLLGFTQDGVTNLQDINVFLSFLLRVMVVFGIAFLIPLIVLMLNILGVIKAKHLVEVPDLRRSSGPSSSARWPPRRPTPSRCSPWPLPMTVLFLAGRGASPTSSTAARPAAPPRSVTT